jgi:hypothetical protein
MLDWLSRLKPGVTPKTHLIIASMLWTAIGLLLLYRGVVYLKADNLLPVAGLGIILGSVKSRYVLDRSAVKSIERIKHFGDNTCVGAVYSWRTWLLVFAMMLFGIMLRASSLPPFLIGFACTAIGWSLLYSSRYGWKEIYRRNKE